MVSLKNTQTNRPCISASVVYRFSSTKLFATFKIDESIQKDYTYDVEISDGEDITHIASTKLLVDPLTVVDGNKGGVAIHTSMPAGVRVDENLDVEVVVKNEVDADVLPPLTYFNVTGDVRIRIIREQRIVQFGGNLVFLAASFDQPSGILLPKHVAKFDFEVIPNERETATLPMYIQRLDEAAPDTPHPYMGLEDKLKPTHMSKRRWKPVWNQFIRTLVTL